MSEGMSERDKAVMQVSTNGESEQESGVETVEEETNGELQDESPDDASEKGVEDQKSREQLIEENRRLQERLKEYEARLDTIEAIIGKEYLEQEAGAPEVWKGDEQDINLFKRATGNSDAIYELESEVKELKESTESNVVQAAAGEMEMEDGPEKRAMFLAERFGDLSYKIPAAESALAQTQIGLTTKTLDSRDKTTVNKIFDQYYNEDLQAVQVTNAMKKAAETFPDKLEFRDPNEDRYKYLLYSGGD